MRRSPVQPADPAGTARTMQNVRRVNAARPEIDFPDSIDAPGHPAAAAHAKAAVTSRLQIAASGAGRFDVLHEIGRGGMGVVAAAEDRALRRQVAIKTLRQQPAATRDLATVRFIDEAQITGQLQHPNIVPVYELGVNKQGAPFMVMRHIAGRTLRMEIDDAHEGAAAHGDDTAALHRLRALLDAFLKACDAVAYAHSRGVIHRDLKPDNVMVGEYGEVLVVDWGLARPIGSTAPDAPTPRDARRSRTPSDTRDARRGPTTRSFDSGSRVSTDRHESGIELTQDGAISGTLPYMPPEQAVGRVSQLDEGADIYALGAILYHILAGRPPFSGKADERMLSDVIEARFEPPSVAAPHAQIPRELEAVVLKAMARRRKDRYATVGDLQDDVRNWFAGRTLAAAEYTQLQRLAKWAARHKAAVISGGAAAFVLAVASVIVVLMQHSAELATARAETAAAQERAAREEAEVRDMLQKNQINKLREQVGLESQFKRNDAVNTFTARYFEWEKNGRSYEEFFATFSAGEIENFIESFKQVFRASARSNVVWYDASDYFFLGLLYGFGKKDSRFGLWLFEQALELRPDYVEVYVNRAILWHETGDTTQALDDLEHAA
ncbi:MAG: protein kinase, partial [Planctomycetota bacterium]